MSWASSHIEKLKAGETVAFRPVGRSMEPKIASGQLCSCEPVDKATLNIGDIVLCRVGRRDYLHNILAVDTRMATPRFQIGNNKGGINGWIGRDLIFGKLIKIAD